MSANFRFVGFVIFVVTLISPDESGALAAKASSSVGATHPSLKPDTGNPKPIARLKSYLRRAECPCSACAAAPSDQIRSLGLFQHDALLALQEVDFAFLDQFQQSNKRDDERDGIVLQQQQLPQQ